MVMLYEQGIYKYNLELYDAIMECFDNLPIAATVNEKWTLPFHLYLCYVLFYLLFFSKQLRDIEEIDRFQEVPREGPFCDLLWADPVDEDKEKDDEERQNEEDGMDNELTTWFAYNETRQCSYVFGVDAVVTFLKKNNLTAIIRAHEAQFDGYKMQFINEQTSIPRVITIFSAPNYCDVYKNKGACLKFDDELLNIRQFVNSPHPYYLPNFMDVSHGPYRSLPKSILSFGVDEDVDTDAAVKAQGPSEVLRKKGGVLKDKVVAVTKLMRMVRLLKENQNNIVKLKQLSPNRQLPSGILQGGQAAIEKALSSFNDAKRADKPNDAMPSQEKDAKSPRKSGQIFYRAEKEKDTTTPAENKFANKKWLTPIKCALLLFLFAKIVKHCCTKLCEKKKISSDQSCCHVETIEKLFPINLRNPAKKQHFVIIFKNEKAQANF
ncbi:calcineurin A [Reticulomyxa filosa]|uniref:Calcineurin A n=1 Tax=Reticulomyxa filosa TaxID=46433 RepID=X6NJY6_RETFI|nr:calcineurin A [Reticulomyxa filosa]|eukprot:ETO26625.1 calcineurin A [Reticulomyxa filosa]